MTLSNEILLARLQNAEELRLKMEGLAEKLKNLILLQPPEELLGFLWSRLLLTYIGDSAPNITPDAETKSQRDCLLVALEYVHACLSSFEDQSEDAHQLQEASAEEIVAIAEELRKVSLIYCMASTIPGSREAFGDRTGKVEYLAKTNWVIIRGNRYQVLEEEFFRFVLEPHNEALSRSYGIDADGIAAGIQAIVDTMRKGHFRAVEEIAQRMESTFRIAEERGMPLEEAIKELDVESPEANIAAQKAFMDLFSGGVCNVSRHTNLPNALLEDLSFKSGDNDEFFGPGPLCGTPLRTLPARIKPLIRLGDSFYATDPNFIRDSAYRAIQRGVITRIPEYREQWNKRQKALTENAFLQIFCNQLEGARVFKEVYYRDPKTGQWVENDALILFDDVLLQIESKAGLGAMHSPATDFNSHVRAIQNLVVKAYKQTKRFLDYLASVQEAALYYLQDGQYIEKQKVRLSDYRTVIPIGLTIESFSPFSTMCKMLPEIKPLLGKYPFISMSIDDLFVLNRFLPTTGELFHYLEVRQNVAAIRKAFVFDEVDHLGSYLTNNRFDLIMRKELGQNDQLIWDGFSEEIDRYFAGGQWLHQDPPGQAYPDELKQLLEALSKTQSRGWLKIDSLIRDLGDESRTEFAGLLKQLILLLKEHKSKYLIFSGESPLLIWLCKDEAHHNLNAVIHRAEVVALAMKLTDIDAVCISVNAHGGFREAQTVSVQAPPLTRVDYLEMLDKAEALKARIVGSKDVASPAVLANLSRKLGRNDPCWCGSGKKFKKCHGAPISRA